MMNNPTMEANTGDILHGKNNRNKRGIRPHFIIFLGPDPDSKEQFLGAMLTTSSGYSNIPLKAEHFEKYNSEGAEWKVYYKLSFIPDNLYYKKNEWAPFSKVGQLSKKGLAFVMEKLGRKSPIFFPHNV